jgi:hypothetical protein
MKYSTFPTIVEECRLLKISDLKRLKYLEKDVIRYGLLQWGEEGSVSVIVNTINHEMRLRYTWRQLHEMDYTVALCCRPANLGVGVVWYFRCPKTNRLCRNLYFYDGYFVSRRAIPGILYHKQTESKKYREMGIIYGAVLNDECRYPKKYAKLHYKGKPTRRQLKIDRWQSKMLRGYRLMKSKGF